MPKDYREIRIEKAEFLTKELKEKLEANLIYTVGSLYDTLKKAQEMITSFNGLAGATGIKSKTLEDLFNYIEKELIKN